MSGDSVHQISGGYATDNGSATAGSDYTAINGTLVFAAGETSKQVTVLVNGDLIEENNDTFFVNLSNLIPAADPDVSISDAQGQGNINNDDSVAISINDITYRLHGCC